MGDSENSPGLGPVGAPVGRFPGRLLPGVAKYRLAPLQLAMGEPTQIARWRDKWDKPGLGPHRTSPGGRCQAKSCNQRRGHWQGQLSSTSG